MILRPLLVAANMSKQPSVGCMGSRDQGFNLASETAPHLSYSSPERLRGYCRTALVTTASNFFRIVRGDNRGGWPDQEIVACCRAPLLRVVLRGGRRRLGPWFQDPPLEDELPGMASGRIARRGWDTGIATANHFDGGFGSRWPQDSASNSSLTAAQHPARPPLPRAARQLGNVRTEAECGELQSLGRRQIPE